ncbi:MAG: hypothetical protein QOI71_934 [Gaiellales bacterium]|nr:hypothetical protein [Gaiellales bacterium]MDX6620813.1 hypothetical protein [Gaiellales bacterium]
MRPDSWNIALLVHVVGAIVLVGGLLTASAAAIAGWNDDALTLRRFSYWTLLAVAFPGWIVMRVGAGWIASKEGLDNLKSNPTWLDIGFLTAEGGGLLLLIALILGGIGMRKSRSGGGGGLLKASTVIATVLLAAYVVTVWAMGGKPS